MGELLHYPAPPAVPSSYRSRRVADRTGKAINWHVAGRIKRLRILYGRTQMDVAAILRVSQQKIRAYENGLTRIERDVLWVLAEYFAVEISYFFDGLENSILEQAGYGNLPTSGNNDRGTARQLSEMGKEVQKIESQKARRGLLNYIRIAGDAAERP